MYTNYNNQNSIVTGSAWSTGADQWVALPWSLLWVSIILRHWSYLSFNMIFRSFIHFIIIVAPAYVRHMLGKERYVGSRNFIVAAALFAYIYHPGGGLYRDAVMGNAAEHTGLTAAALFIRLLVGSRTLFWLILVFGYTLPPEIGIPLNAAAVATIMHLKPSEPFCATIQTPAARPFFHTIAASLPLFTILPFWRPELPPDIDICNPIVHWLQVAFGFVLPTCVQLAGDYVARREYAWRQPQRLTPQDRVAWSSRQPSASLPAYQLAALTFLSVSTALWHLLLLRDIHAAVWSPMH